MNHPTLLASIIASALLLGGCGNSSDSPKNTPQNSAGTQQQSASQEDVESGSGPNIPYLRQNHAAYSQYGAEGMTPAPTKDATSLSLTWTIQARSVENATILADHIRFMKERLESGAIPRRWDQLFVMESYMKVNHYYTTSVERSDMTVVISKVATNACAYTVIAAHSDAVSGDFFARGDITKDYSGVAQGILASNACTPLRNDIQAYLDANTMQGGMGGAQGSGDEHMR